MRRCVPPSRHPACVEHGECETGRSGLIVGLGPPTPRGTERLQMLCTLHFALPMSLFSMSIAGTRPRHAARSARSRACAAAHRPRAAGRAGDRVGNRGARGALRRPPGAAALAHLGDAGRTRRRRRTAAPRRGDGRARRGRLWLRRRGRHAARRHHRLFGAHAPPARSDRAGAARDPVDRLGAAVHPVARHFRNLEDHADRGRRVLPGLSRRDGRGALGRPQDRRGRPRVPPLGRADGAAHSAARRAAGLCHRAALRPRARLDVRGRGRTARRLGRARLSAGRRPAARQAGADRRRDRGVRRYRQDHRLAAGRRHGAVPALGRPVWSAILRC